MIIFKRKKKPKLLEQKEDEEESDVDADIEIDSEEDNYDNNIPLTNDGFQCIRFRFRFR